MMEQNGDIKATKLELILVDYLDEKWELMMKLYQVLG